MILISLVGGVLLLVVFVAIEMRQDRPMFDVTLFRQRAFLGVSIATFCIAAGMFAMFPYLSIYLQDILGYSPLATGVRFLPLTAFVFFVPLATRRVAARVPLRIMISAGLALVAAGLALMYGLNADSGWTALLAGFVAGGIGIGIANPALAAGALRVVDPARTGMASGISNTFRLAGVAVGVAALGALLQNRVENSLSTTAGANAHSLGAAVSSAGHTRRRRSAGAGGARKDRIRKRPQRRASCGLVAARGRRTRRGCPPSQPGASSRSGDRRTPEAGAPSTARPSPAGSKRGGPSSFLAEPYQRRERMPPREDYRGGRHMKLLVGVATRRRRCRVGQAPRIEP